MKISGDTSGPWFPDVAADDYGNVHVVWNGPFADNPPADSLVKTAAGPGGGASRGRAWCARAGKWGPCTTPAGTGAPGRSSLTWP